jgi:DNA modification methylase
MSDIVRIGDATLYTGDALSVLSGLPDQSVQTCITSPPYFGLRDYGNDEQIGLESTPDEFVAKLVDVFREVRRVLRDDGTLWLNLGDSYAGSWGNYGGQNRGNGKQREIASGSQVPNHAYDGLESFCPPTANVKGLKPKDLVGIPWRVAFALQSDGWYLRQDIIWHKPNPMPESVTDRCTKTHEYMFLLAKSQRYYYDAEAIKERSAESSLERLSQPNLANQVVSDRVPGKTNGNMKAVGGDMRNKRSVWTVTTKPYSGAHFATFPPDLITPCILAGAPVDGVVLDPFSGSGTTGAVALDHSRKYIGIELNPEYQALAVERIDAASSQGRLFA